jgi:hypothetical protein
MIEQFDDNILEADIAELSKEVQAHAQAPEQPKEAIRGVIGEKLYETSSEGAGSAVGQSSAPVSDPNNPLPDYAAAEPAEVRLEVEKLLDTTMHKGLASGIAEARKKDPATLKLFHDSITEKLYVALKRRGIIK